MWTYGVRSARAWVDSCTNLHPDARRRAPICDMLTLAARRVRGIGLAVWVHHDIVETPAGDAPAGGGGGGGAAFSRPDRRGRRTGAGLAPHHQRPVALQMGRVPVLHSGHRGGDRGHTRLETRVR